MASRAEVAEAGDLGFLLGVFDAGIIDTNEEGPSKCTASAGSNSGVLSADMARDQHSLGDDRPAWNAE